jgi:peptidoglycan/xylan/chitin deacetylase (PgdA/CDA1 family)
VEHDGRRRVKQALASLARGRPAGLTVLIYHRVGGGTADELDMPVDEFERQLDVLVDGGHDVVALDVALDRLDAGDDRPTVVLTFDDGFADLYDHAWPRLRDRSLPFTLYLAAGLVGSTMAWEGSTGASQGAPALTWRQVEQLAGSGACTVGNHTFTHAGPAALTADEVDRCSAEVERRVGARPRHFAYTWGIEVPSMRPVLRERFRSAVTGRIGRNGPAADRLALCRVPVRRTDPIEFFRAKVGGGLGPEHAYDVLVRGAKRLRRGA